MIETKPWPGHPDLPEGDVTTTVEFTTWEVTEALWDYLQFKKGAKEESHITLQVRTDSSNGSTNGVSFRLTYWPLPKAKT